MPFLFMLRVALVATDEGEGLGEFLPADHLASGQFGVRQAGREIRRPHVQGLHNFVWLKNSHGFKQRLTNPCVLDDRPEGDRRRRPESAQSTVVCCQGGARNSIVGRTNQAVLGKAQRGIILSD